MVTTTFSAPFRFSNEKSFPSISLALSPYQSATSTEPTTTTAVAAAAAAVRYLHRDRGGSSKHQRREEQLEHRARENDLRVGKALAEAGM